MQIDLPADLEQALILQAAQSNLPLQTFILQALRQLVHPQPGTIPQWPAEILNYPGDPDFPAFESHRQDLLAASTSSLAFWDNDIDDTEWNHA